VILADTNFWLALSLSRHVFHSAARDWLAAQSSPASVLFCRSTQQSFLRLLTTEVTTRPYDIPPMTNAGAWKLYDGLISDRRIAWAAEPQADGLEKRWKDLAARGTASPKLWMDAYLAAFALAGGHQLVTTDKAFAQFKGLDAIVLAATKATP
jgi:toxin-antitoxin system PIN domain toxin